ncbi:MAG: DUF2249 domain-containing protein [Nakamurella sp.]
MVSSAETETGTRTSQTTELDVRPLRKPDKHPTIFARYAELSAGDSFVLVNDHEPKHLKEEFQANYPGSYQWECLQGEPRDWRIRITKLTSTALPRVLVNSAGIGAQAADPDGTGALWKLEMRDRDLDSNIFDLPPNGTIDAYTGPDLDILVHVVAGAGQLSTEVGTVGLRPGDVLWLPRRSRRQFTAGPDGLRYLTVHQRRRALHLDTSRVGARR